MINNSKLEYSVLACLMLNEDCLYHIDKISEKDFTDRFAIETFKAIRELTLKNKAIDYLSIHNINKNLSLQRLMELAETLPGTKNFESYLEDLKQTTERRQLFQIADTIKNLAFNNEDKALDKAERMVMEVREQHTTSNMQSIKDIVIDTYEDITIEIEDPEKLSGLDTGFKGLNNMLSGLTTGYNVLAARPSMGKTTLGLNIVTNIALNGNLGAVFSLETTKKKITKRLALSRAPIRMNYLKEQYVNMKKGKISKEKFRRLQEDYQKKITDAMNYINKLDIFIDDTAGVTVEHIKAECRRLKKRTGKKIGIIMIDYLQLMEGPGEEGNQKVSAISKQIRGLSKEFDCPVLVISQLSRKVEMRQNKRPMMSDLRESGQIEQDADTIMFVYRDSYYNPEDADPYEAEIIVAKSKDGETGIFKMDCVLENYRFLDFGSLERRH